LQPSGSKCWAETRGSNSVRSASLGAGSGRTRKGFPGALAVGRSVGLECRTARCVCCQRQRPVVPLAGSRLMRVLYVTNSDLGSKPLVGVQALDGGVQSGRLVRRIGSSSGLGRTLPRCVFMPSREWIFFHASRSEAAVAPERAAAAVEGWHAQPSAVVALWQHASCVQLAMRPRRRVGGTGRKTGASCVVVFACLAAAELALVAEDAQSEQAPRRAAGESR